MPDAGFNININRNGPIFDGRARAEAQRGCQDAERAVAEEANRQIHQRLHQVLKNPTGYYESHVRVMQRGGRHIVTDRPVVYGPWLEGTGSRNFPVTRFRGYSTFRMVKALVQRQAPNIVRRALGRYTGRM